jgi:serine/alanine adding enzyme
MSSNFTIVDSLHHEQWDKYVYEHPGGTIFHTRHLVDVFERTKHYCPLFLAAVDEGNHILALLTSVRVQSLPSPLGNLSSRSIFYAEPLCSDEPRGIEALTALLAEHDSRLQKKALFSEVRALHHPGRAHDALTLQGYEHDGYLNFLVDLRQPSDVLWGRLTGSCRSNIRRGEKRGLTIKEETSDKGVDILYQMLKLTYKHARVPLADKSLFTNALRVLQPLEMVKVFVAFHAEQPVGASIVLLYKKVVYEWYWGVQRIKSIYPAECVTWHRISWGQQQEYACYDFGGAGWADKPYGVRDFKAKFGGDLVNYGRYRKVYSPWMFSLGERAYEWNKKLTSSRNWLQRHRTSAEQS